MHFMYWKKIRKKKTKKTDFYNFAKRIFDQISLINEYLYKI